MDKVQQTIQNNEMKLALYIVLITLVIMGLGYLVSEVLNLGMLGLFISLLFAAGANFFAYFFSKTVALKSQHAVRMQKEDFPEYFNMVEEMCRRNNILMPELYYIPTNALNAFATGRNQKNAAVAITTGLLKSAPMDEISGVIGHELAHVVHKDILITSFITTLIGYISILATTLRTASMYRTSNRDDNQNMGLIFLVGTAAAILVPVAGTLIRMAVSRSREYMADATGGQICGNPKYLARALYRISHDGNPMPTADTATAPMYISNPLKGTPFASLMSTHPDINDRIRRLNEM